MSKVAAVIVTFNRLGLLKESIGAVSNQTRKPDAIIVVNNGSTDGTREYLDQHSGIIAIHQQNLGGAGGFATGVSAAYDHGFDWIWLMDDDAFPERSCLELLLSDLRGVDNYDVVVAPLVVEDNKVDHLHRGLIDLSRIKYPLQVETTEALLLSKDKIDVSFVSFVGMLVGRRIVDLVGLPDQKYFIFNDDVEYSIRICKAGCKMYLIRNAIIYHKIPGSLDKLSLSPNTTPMLRRTLLDRLIERRIQYSELSLINVLSFISMRNWIWTIVRHSGLSLGLIGFLLKDFGRGCLYILLSKGHKLLLIRLYYLTYTQGLSGRFENSRILDAKKGKRK